MIRLTAPERARRLRHGIAESRRYPHERSLTPDEREAFHERLIAAGWKVGKRRPHPWLADRARCVACGDAVTPTDDPLDRLCERCRDKRR